MLGKIVVLVFVCTMLAVKFFVSRAAKMGLVDVPNQRSAHVQPTPRGGGVVFVGAWVVFCLLFGYWDKPTHLVEVACPLAIAALGFLDDRFQLSARLRLAFQIAVAFIFSLHPAVRSAAFDFGIVTLHLPLAFNILFITLLLVWSVNIFNFMDGIDGIATIEAIVVLLALSLFSWQASELGNQVLSSMTLVAALAGFLVWNFPKASVFMGDVGSGFLGFLLASTAIIGQVAFHIPIYLFFIVYGVFAVDTFITIIRRMLAGEKWYEPHRVHAYQRLQHIMGWKHPSILAYAGFFNSILFLTAYLASHQRIKSGSALLVGFLTAMSYYIGVEILCTLKKSSRSTKNLPS